MSYDPSRLVTSEKIKRRRVTTACRSCRDHRVRRLKRAISRITTDIFKVKCDRVRPAGGRCQKKACDCKYIDDDDGRTIEFTEPFRLNNGGRTPATSGYWSSIIENQVKTVRQSSVAGSDLPT